MDNTIFDKRKRNQKSNSWFNIIDAQKILAKMVSAILKETNDTRGILNRIVFQLETRINGQKLLIMQFNENLIEVEKGTL